MLNRLYVKNVALISEADIEFDSGLNVLSGETGSGKSVLLESVNFVLGSKADRSMIRYGESEAFVRAELNVDCCSEAVKKLAEYDIESDGEIIITRKLNTEGKGAIKINGNTVTTSMLKSVTQYLVDVHGQSEHFFLLNEANQLKVIDGLLGARAQEIKDGLAETLKLKRSLIAEINSLGGSEEERARKLDLLGYQINEIDGAELKVGEYDELKTKQNVIINMEKILSALNAVQSILNDDGGCIDGLSSAIHMVNQLSSLGDDYSQLASRLESLNAEATDVCETVSDMSDSLTFDPDEAQRIDERITLIKTLRKKYGADEEEILAFAERAKAEYDAVSDSAATIEKRQKQIAECDEKLYKLSCELTKLRKSAAEEFCGDVVNELRTLNIPDAKFGVTFSEYDRESVKFTANGADEVRFEFSANKGEPLKPLSKVISGGEMSRFMLAIKTRLKDLNGISTYIFDEIDAGISGITAGKVARKFAEIAKHTQILAVSHLPQVCAASDAQFLIYKEETDGKTLTKVKRLDYAQKVDEIMRLTGSVSSEAARIHAEELIGQFKN